MYSTLTLQLNRTSGRFSKIEQPQKSYKKLQSKKIGNMKTILKLTNCNFYKDKLVTLQIQ